MEERKPQDSSSGVVVLSALSQERQMSPGTGKETEKEKEQGVIGAADKPLLQMRKTEAQHSSAQFNGTVLVRARPLSWFPGAVVWGRWPGWARPLGERCALRGG